VFLPHLGQISSYALHRGYFAKRFPQTSLRWYYFLPSIFVFSALAGGILGLFFGWVRFLYLSALYLYLSAALLGSYFILLPPRLGLIEKSKLFFLVWWGIVFTHLAYGTYFIKGLLVNKLSEEK
jgi:hypothetical protein